MLLKRIIPFLPKELAALIPEFESADIRTTEAIIFSPPATVLSLTTSIAPDQLEAFTFHCIKATSQPCVSANVLPHVVAGPWKGWGVKGMDELVEDWDGVGVVEIAGTRKSGKSLLALHAALKIIAEDGMAKCMWLDTEGAFSPERAERILESWNIPGRTGVLERLVVIPCFKLEDIYEALETFKTLGATPENPRTKVLVIDTVFTHLRDILTNTSAQGHAELVSLMEIIAEVTYSNSIVSLVINSTATSLPTNPLSSFNALNIKPALGTSFTYTTDITLLVQETGKVFGMMDEEERERIRRKPGLRAFVEVIKSRVSSTGSWSVFETDGTILYDVVPPPLISELPRGPPRPAMGPLRQTMIP